ncbi:hypothetical protein DL96DRAFT_1541301 [Flagelloscypha sp. PMI_526]|nr:hypothetical protein DL96DRAFT_1541301 [Flagelloscypha sp. PMI_526]
MIAHYVSPDYGWLESKDGSETAMVIFRAGKNRDGYFTCQEVLDQFRHAVQLAYRLYPGDDHIFMYDNAKTHRARDDTARSASKMPKGPSKNFFVKRTVIDSKGKESELKVQMDAGWYHDGSEKISQPLYFPPDHPVYPGWFKGMEKILLERGHDIRQKKAQCAQKFKDCPNGSTACCLRRMLFNEPDFVNVPSRLENLATEFRTRVMFTPKFHCEVNCIEQCWGYAKRRYREMDTTQSEDAMERKVIQCLREVPIASIRLYAQRSLRWMDAYRHGMVGEEALYAVKKYKGHRMIPSDQQKD